MSVAVGGVSFHSSGDQTLWIPSHTEGTGPIPHGSTIRLAVGPGCVHFVTEQGKQCRKTERPPPRVGNLQTPADQCKGTGVMGEGHTVAAMGQEILSEEVAVGLTAGDRPEGWGWQTQGTSNVSKMSCVT